MFRLVTLAVLLAATSLAQASLEGEPAPPFSLPDQHGETHTLEDYRGRWLVVFFYPRADTPGCTAEACNFRDNIYAFRAADAAVIGISVDPVAAQQAFAEKYSLPFTLLSDEAGEVCVRYGVARQLGDLQIANRETFLIDPDGRVVRHYTQVDPETHTQDVIADLEQFRQAAPG